MKRIVTASLRSLIALAFAATCGVAAASEQVRDARVVSARAGGVNFVSGDVSARRQGESAWRALSTKDELQTGDEVRTGADGRVEILLNPGSYFRAGGGAEFTLADASLEDLRVGLTRGSAVVEATGYSDMDISITVATPRSLVRIVRSGVYRINVAASGAAEVAVLKGRAAVGATLVKGGKVAREGAGGVEVTKLDKKERDELDLWSRERGKELAKANEKLSRQSMKAALAQLRLDSFAGSGRYGFAGLWLWSAVSNCYTFLPFYSYWQSPYGFGYWREAAVITRFYNPSCQCEQSFTPPGISRNGETYNPPPPSPSYGGPGAVGSSTGMGSPVGDGSSGRETMREVSRPSPGLERAPGAGATPRDRP